MFFVIYIEYFPYCLFVSNSQVIGCEDRLQNDLLCVEWDVKLYTVTHSLCLVYSIEQEALGRGINVVIIDSRTKLVTKVERFDTYQFGESY